MPRLPKEFVRRIVYIYPTETAAREDTEFGGTGFLVAYHDRDLDVTSTYVATAAHVVVGKGTMVLRVNTKDSFKPIPVPQEAWVYQVDTDGLPRNDLAVSPVVLPEDELDVEPFHITPQSTVGQGGYMGASLGDDVLMVGRFKFLGGETRNRPAASFGTIYMMPEEPLKLRARVFREAFLIEMRSRRGYSGSPVYIFEGDFGPDPVRDLSRALRDARFSMGFPPRPRGAKLLGIHHGQFRDDLDVVYEGGNSTEPVEVGGRRILVSDAGAISIVIPSWCLLNLLNDERLVAMRKPEADDKARLPRAEEESEEEPKFTREDFESALWKTTRRVNKPHDEPERR